MSATPPPAPRRSRFGAFLVLAVLVGGLVGGYLWWRGRGGVSTDDAFLRADVVQVPAEVGGRVVEVLVAENVHVDAGAPLLRLDPSDYQLKVAQAEANLAAAQADARRAEEAAAAARSDVRMGEVKRADADRERRLQEGLAAEGAAVKVAAERAAATASVASQGVSTARMALHAAVAAAEAARARIPAAEAALALARRDLALTEVRAPTAGVASKVELQPGELVQRGQTVLALVPDARYLVANFKETDLARIHPGDPVDIEVDAYPDAPLSGTVASVGAGTGAVFALLPADNATGNFIKVVQRVPVRVALASDASRLPAGLSATVRVRSAIP